MPQCGVVGLRLRTLQGYQLVNTTQHSSLRHGPWLEMATTQRTWPCTVVGTLRRTVYESRIQQVEPKVQQPVHCIYSVLVVVYTLAYCPVSDVQYTVGYSYWVGKQLT